ncbi:MAG: hypothetical protein IT376_04350 [Polyangiaceae bacterium]|nr:hypothetical protein [Polyangiaceae bacterium]
MNHRSSHLIAAAALAILTTSTAGALADPDERPVRVVTFTDGDAARVEVDGDTALHGDSVVELQLKGTNPLCYAYSTNLRAEASTVPARRPAPTKAAAPIAAVTYDTAEAAAAGLKEAREAVAAALAAARRDASVDDVWRGCRTTPDVASQRARVELANEQLGAHGDEWMAAIVRARAAVSAARAAAQSAPPPEVAAGELALARQGVLDAEREERQASERLAAARTGGRKPPEDVVAAAERATQAANGARSRLSEAERRLTSAHRGLEIRQTALALDDEARAGERELVRIETEVTRAVALLAAAPSTVRRSLAAGEDVTVRITKVPLVRGRPMRGAKQTFASPQIVALRPILFDVGFGPTFTFRNTQEYGLGVRNTSESPQIRTRVVRTRDGLNFDGMVAVSAYVWGRRYLDDRVFDWRFLLPRPVVGASVAQPFSSGYAGLSIDPVQFVDVSAGLRWYEREKLIAPTVGSIAAPAEDGTPAEPVTQREVRRDVFVAVTASTDLFARWFGRR